MSEDEKRGLTYEQFQKAKPLIYAEGMREGCEELMLEAAKMSEEVERLRAAAMYWQKLATDAGLQGDASWAVWGNSGLHALTQEEK